MSTQSNTTAAFEVVYALEGQIKALSISVPIDASNASILAKIAAKHSLADDVELYWEDDDDALADADNLLDRLKKDFRQIHVARPSKIDVSVTYNGKTANHRFRPNATIRRVIVWSISEKGLDLVGKPNEFQIKLGGKVIPPETHLGQLAKGDATLEFVLVANIKPQGC